jgi:hypothetical protein
MVVVTGDPGGFVQFYQHLLPFSHVMRCIIHKGSIGFWVHDFRIAAPYEIAATEEASYP